ncbi:MFS transporter [Solimicrobium silvestre]|uniref:Arabinose efflux permease n=1 Tax=Solimicrobium silvestre TaxID=2099400 RepID=A0A2S9H585_9BURK|nr:MFS transporter [Solimicrobium silvestre]PRC95127.1 Arabinose efflux permease [Solimicrobium silvestre]
MYQLPPGRERGLLWLLALTQFTIIMDFMVMMPLGPQIMHKFAIGPAAFATAVSAYAWCSGLSSLFAATYIDRFDRRKLLLVVYALFALSNLACASAPTFSMLLIARAFAGLTGGVLSSIIMAILGDVIPQNRRGAATGIIMTSFSLAAVAGVPAGIVLGAKFGWSSPFYLLVVLSLIIWLIGAKLVPTLTGHLAKKPAPLSRTLPDLINLIREPRHLRAYMLTFIMMTSHMLIIPFISPVIVANLNVAPQQLSWIYMAGGAATFFTSRFVGRMADRFGKHNLFRLTAVLSMLPILFITHLPTLPFMVLVAFFAVFMVLASSRMIPMQALLTTIPKPAQRGAFLSINSAIQSLGTGCGAWIGGMLLATTANGQIAGYGTNGWLSVGMVVFTLIWVGQVQPAKEPEQSSIATKLSVE